MTPRAPKRRATVTVVLTEEERDQLVTYLWVVFATTHATVRIAVEDAYKKLRRARVAKRQEKKK